MLPWNFIEEEVLQKTKIFKKMPEVIKSLKPLKA